MTPSYHAKHPGHHINSNIIYGITPSRRYGQSLGINLLPANRKYCNFNCVYCQLGWNKESAPQKSDYPSLTEIKIALSDFFENNLDCDVLSLCGNGEPTLHPDFPAVIDLLLELKAKYKNETPVLCLTNGSQFHRQEILASLGKISEVAVKLDPHFRKVELPEENFNLESMLQGIRELKNASLQACLFKGRINNNQNTVLDEWIQLIADLPLQKIDLYTLSRETAATGLTALSENEMEVIAKKLRLKVSSPVYFCADNTESKSFLDKK